MEWPELEWEHRSDRFTCLCGVLVMHRRVWWQALGAPWITPASAAVMKSWLFASSQCQERNSSVEELLLQAAAVTGRVFSSRGVSKPAVHVSRGVHWGTSAAWVNQDSETCSPEWELVAIQSDDAQWGANLAVCAVLEREWMWALPVALCNPLPVAPLFQVLVTNGWFQSSTNPWKTSFRVYYGSLRFVTTPILAPKNGSGKDWQNPSCCPDAKSWELGALVTCPGCAFGPGCPWHGVFHHFRTWIFAWSLWLGTKSSPQHFFTTLRGNKATVWVFWVMSVSSSIQHLWNKHFH